MSLQSQFQFKYVLRACARLSRIYRNARATSAYEHFVFVEGVVERAKSRVRALTYRDFLTGVGLCLRLVVRNPRKALALLALAYLYSLRYHLFVACTRGTALLALYVAEQGPAYESLGYTLLASTLGLFSPYLGYRVIWYYTLWVADHGMDLVCPRDFGDSYLESFVGIDWWEYFGFALFWPQHVFYLKYYFDYIDHFYFGVFQARRAFGEWGGWAAFNRRMDFGLWSYLASCAAACKSPLAINDVVIFNTYWHTFDTRIEYRLWFYKWMVVETRGMRAWVLPGCLYAPETAGLPEPFLYAYEQIVEGFTNKYSMYGTFNSPYNVMAKRLTPEGKALLRE